MEENMLVIRYPTTFYFNFDLPRGVDENSKGEIEFVIKSNESLAEIIIKNEIEQLLLKHKHGNNIHEHRQRINHINLFLICHIDLRSRDKHVVLQYLSIYYTWKNTRKK